MIIERAQVNDVEQILSLQKLAYMSEAKLYNDYKIEPLMQTLDKALEEFELQLILKASINGKIIGSVRAHEAEGTCYIGRLMVHPDFENRGIGRDLMINMEQSFPNCKRFELYTGGKSLKNIGFYEKLGYKLFKRESFREETTVFAFMEKLVR